MHRQGRAAAIGELVGVRILELGSAMGAEPDYPNLSAHTPSRDYSDKEEWVTFTLLHTLPHTTLSSSKFFMINFAITRIWSGAF